VKINRLQQRGTGEKKLCSKTFLLPGRTNLQARKRQAIGSRSTKSIGSNSFFNCIVVFKLSSDSKSEQIFAPLNSDCAAGMMEQDFARCRIEGWHHDLDFDFRVYRGTDTGKDKGAAEPDISAITHSRMRCPVLPMTDDGEDQTKTRASSSLDPTTSLCLGGPSWHGFQIFSPWQRDHSQVPLVARIILSVLI
jgi:hypothetical protein